MLTTCWTGAAARQQAKSEPATAAPEPVAAPAAGGDEIRGELERQLSGESGVRRNRESYVTLRASSWSSLATARRRPWWWKAEASACGC